MAFEVSGKGGAGPVPGVPPNFIQIQADGTNLGLPSVDTLDFGAGLTATRGTGLNADKVTVVAVGGGAGGESDTMVVGLSGAVSGAFDGSNFENWDTASVYGVSADAEWSDADQQIRFITAGLYEVQVQGYVSPDSGIWPSADQETTTFGSNIAAIGQSTSTHFRYSVGGVGDSGPQYAVFNDRFVLNASADTLRPFSLYANRYLSTDDATFRAVLSVKRIGNSVGG